MIDTDLDPEPPDPGQLEEMALEDALFPWLADDSMADHVCEDTHDEAMEDQEEE